MPQGDNLLAEFPSVVDTVQCAVEIQQELAERNAQLPEERKEDNFQVRKFFEQAIALDHNYPLSHAILGWCHLSDIFFGWSESPLESFERTEKLA